MKEHLLKPPYITDIFMVLLKEIADDKVLIVDPQGLVHFKSLNDPRIVAFSWMLLVAQDDTE